MNKIVELTVAVAVLVFVGCRACYSPREPEPVIVEQPGKDLCDEACEHMSTLDDGGPCDEATDIVLKDGGKVSCVEFCIYQHDNGIFWNTKCLTTIVACSEVEKCATPAE